MMLRIGKGCRGSRGAGGQQVGENVNKQRNNIFLRDLFCRSSITKGGFMPNSATGTAVDVQSLIFQKNVQRFSTFSKENKTWFKGNANIQLHQEPQVASERLAICTGVFNFNKIPQAFANGNGSFDGHIDKGKTMNLDPERGGV
jgi:hypothetical protein